MEGLLDLERPCIGGAPNREALDSDVLQHRRIEGNDDRGPYLSSKRARLP